MLCIVNGENNAGGVDASDKTYGYHFICPYVIIQHRPCELDVSKKTQSLLSISFCYFIYFTGTFKPIYYLPTYPFGYIVQKKHTNATNNIPQARCPKFAK